MSFGALFLATSLAEAVAPVPPVPAAQPPAVAEPPPQWTPPVLHTLAMHTTTRVVEAALWPDPFARTDLGFWAERYEEAFTKPPRFDPDASAFEWDGDPWQINVLGHGLMGSEMYLRARSCGFGWTGSLGFTAAGAAAWEYGFEANGVRPSAQDLVFTPLAGLVLGEGRYRLWHAAGGIEQAGLRALVRTLIDPLGELERAVFRCPC